MTRSRERRFLRRLAERRGDRALAEKMARLDPRTGEDRRQAERRTEALTGAALDRRLRELGITDRRSGQRRTADRRR